MCGNRVEELETRVQELEASVEGLTDELVECKVRIRELENTVDEQSGFSRSPPEQAGEKPAESRSEEPAAESRSEEPAAQDGEETTTESEILVPEADTPNTEAPEDADNETPDAEAESEAEEDSGSDIIVA